MLFGIRHGERGDRVQSEKSKVEIKIDPHLTPNGIKQAAQTGIFIQKKIDEYFDYLKKNNKTTEQENKIQAIIITSPFLRTIQTSFSIAQQLKNVYQNTIFLHYEVCEYLCTRDYNQPPLDNIYFKIKPENELRQNYLNFFQDNNKLKIQENFFTDNTIYVPKFPENDQQLEDRMSSFLGALSLHYIQYFAQDKFVLIYISHQSVVEEGLRYYQAGIPAYTLGYCGVMQVIFKNIENNTLNYEVLMKGENEHLEDKGTL